MKHSQWTTEDWMKVLWTDELKFEIFSSSRRIFVCRRVGEMLAPQCVTSPVKHVKQVSVEIIHFKIYVKMHFFHPFFIDQQWLTLFSSEQIYFC